MSELYFLGSSHEKTCRFMPLKGKFRQQSFLKGTWQWIMYLTQIYLKISPKSVKTNLNHRELLVQKHPLDFQSQDTEVLDGSRAILYDIDANMQHHAWGPRVQASTNYPKNYPKYWGWLKSSGTYTISKQPIRCTGKKKLKVNPSHETDLELLRCYKIKSVPFYIPFFSGMGFWEVEPIKLIMPDLDNLWYSKRHMRN